MSHSTEGGGDLRYCGRQELDSREAVVKSPRPAALYRARGQELKGQQHAGCHFAREEQRYPEGAPQFCADAPCVFDRTTFTLHSFVATYLVCNVTHRPINLYEKQPLTSMKFAFLVLTLCHLHI